MLDWSKVPDILAIACLVCAFASILKRNRRFVPEESSGSGRWLVGWILIVVHFFGYMFLQVPGLLGMVMVQIGSISLAAAGIFFSWATIPNRRDKSSLWMASVLLVTISAMVGLDGIDNTPTLVFDILAILLALAPIAVTLAFRKEGISSVRKITVSAQLILGIVLLISHHTGLGGPSLLINAILFTVYLKCTIHFWFTHRTATAGAFITIAGFLAWTLVFVLGPWLSTDFPNLHLESEVWNLPKYVVAVGMLLLLLENQIERSQYLALHDELTHLANRRLFQDRLLSAMERARRSSSSMGLLLIDLDRFKSVNDTYGHHIGDLLLRDVARRLEVRVRRSDTIARTGGDEFSLVLEEPTLRHDAEALAKVLVKMLSQPFVISGKRITIGATVGVAIYPEDGLDSEALCISADQRMYASKPASEPEPANR